MKLTKRAVSDIHKNLGSLKCWSGVTAHRVTIAWFLAHYTNRDSFAIRSARESVTNENKWVVCGFGNWGRIILWLSAYVVGSAYSLRIYFHS